MEGTAEAAQEIARLHAELHELRARVTAPSNEAITKSFAIPYFRSKRYFGIKAPGYFLDVGKPQTFAVVSVAPGGKPAAGPAGKPPAR